MTSIGAGGTAGFAVSTDGTVWGWGDNNTGQLGDGGVCGKTCPTPVKVSGLGAGSGVVAVTGGYVHTLAVLSDGSLRGWGRNAEGELGDGTTTVRATPVAVSVVSEVKPVPAVNASYTYDGDGLRATRTSTVSGAGGTQHFGWQLGGAVPLVLTDGSTSYLYDDAGLPVEQVDAAGTALYYGHDQYGSTRLLTDQAGAVAATYTYDPYGTLTARTGTADTPLRWNGQYQDPDTNLYYLRARYYDPTTAQFLTRDPLEALTQAPYGYGVGDPLNIADPAGLDPFFGALGAAIGAIAGGVVGAAGYAVQTQLLHQETFSWRGLVGSTVGGAVGGAISGGCIGLTDGIGTVACNAVAGGVGEFVTESVGGTKLNATNIGASAFLGAAIGYIPDPFPLVDFRPWRMFNVWNPGKNAWRQYGNSFVEGGLNAAMVGLVNGLERARARPC